MQKSGEAVYENKIVAHRTNIQYVFVVCQKLCFLEIKVTPVLKYTFSCESKAKQGKGQLQSW